MKPSNFRRVLAFAVSGLAVSAAAQDCVIMNPLCPATGTGGSATSRKLLLDGDLAILADATNDLRIFDISNVSNPVLLSATIMQSGASRDVALSGTTAYVANGTDLSVFDIADPMAPILIGRNDQVDTQTLEARGSVIYSQDGLFEVAVLDYEDPANPIRVATLSEIYVRSITLHENRLYVGGNLLWVYDISEPLSPVLHGNYDNPQIINQITVRDNLAYLACEDYGVQIVNIADPQSIQLVGAFTPGSPLSISVQGDYAYVGGPSSFDILDIAIPDNPYFVGRHIGDGEYHSFAFRDGLVYSLSALNGLEIFEQYNRCDECLPDVNLNGDVDRRDFTAWIAAFNSSAPFCDQNGDRECTPADFTAWIANYNAGCP